MKTISILGSTGSIGTQTLEVCKAYDIYPAALAAHSNIALLEQQARQWRPKLAAVYDEGAAKELKIENEVTVEYVCGGQFYGDADITAYMDTWYSTKGVEIVFACGGGIYTSAGEAAVKTGGKVIGVDSDQSATIDGLYGEGITITSAMKGLDATVKSVLTAIKDGKWGEYVGKIENLGLVSENNDENYVKLPVDTTVWNDGFTKDDYNTLVTALYKGEVVVNNDITALPQTAIAVNDYGSIK